MTPARILFKFNESTYQDCLPRSLHVNAQGLLNSILISVKSITGASEPHSRSCSHLMHRCYRNVCDSSVTSLVARIARCACTRGSRLWVAPCISLQSDIRVRGRERSVRVNECRLLHVRRGGEDAEIDPGERHNDSYYEDTQRESSSHRPMLLHFDRSRIGVAKVAS